MNQKKYENRWKDYAAVQRYVYMMHVERIAMERKLTLINLGIIDSKKKFTKFEKPRRKKYVRMRGQNINVVDTPLKAIKE
jgi:hypothetical protein